VPFAGISGVIAVVMAVALSGRWNGAALYRGCDAIFMTIPLDCPT